MPINSYSALRRISKYVDWTPVRYSIYLSKLFKREIYLKLENFQVTGSFKVRGVFNKFLKLLKDEREDKCFLTVSTGNHGLAFAYAIKLLGLKGKIIVPKNITMFKLERLKSLDVQLTLLGDNYDEAERKARKVATRENCEFISPYNDLDVIEGQGTIGVEILHDLPEVETVVVPVGGGGLISGVSYVLKKASSKYKIVGIQSEASKPMVESFKRGKPVKVEIRHSIADGLSGNIEDESITFNLVMKYVDNMVAVNEKSILDAMKTLYTTEGLIVEGSAAVTLAALLENKEEIPEGTSLLILTGGNADLSKTTLTLNHQQKNQNRYLLTPTPSNLSNPFFGNFQ